MSSIKFKIGDLLVNKYETQVGVIGGDRLELNPANSVYLISSVEKEEDNLYYILYCQQTGSFSKWHTDYIDDELTFNNMWLYQV